MPAKYIGEDVYAEDVAVASAARTITGNTATLVDYGGAGSLRAQLDVTASGGVGPTLDVVIQDSLDGTNWNTIGTFAQRAAAGREVINVTTPFAKRLRVSWTITGATPSFTFAVIVVSQSPST